MNMRKRIPVVLATISLPITLALFPVQVRALPLSCGPGPHWVDTCPAGIDALASTATVEIDLDFDGMTDQILVLDGATTIQRTGPLDDSMNFPGVAPIDGHFEVIDLVNVASSLSGSGATLTLGPGVTPGGETLGPSWGVVWEQPGDPSLADSFLSLFFEIDLGGGVFVYNSTPVSIDADGLAGVFPSGTSYSSGPVSLLLYENPPTGPSTEPVAVLTSFVLTVPEPGTGLLLGLGLVGLTLAARRRRG